MRQAVVLLSGGLDSTTCMSYAIKNGYTVYPISFDYGQKFIKELDCAKAIVKYYKLKSHKIVKIDNFGGSALTDKNIKVPNSGPTEEIPLTYVPARNMIFLSYAAGYAEVVDADAIFIGVNCVEHFGYPDCKPEFIKAFSEMIKLGTKKGIEGRDLKVITPLINLSKSDIISMACENRAPIHLTTSCYKGGEKACGVCNSCVVRLRGFKEAGIEDPEQYETNQ